MQRMRIGASVRMFGSLGLMLWLWNPGCGRRAAQHKELAKRVDAILSRPDVARGFWGVEIEELDTGRVVYSHDADKLLTPASNTKLFTTAAALALIGPDYRFRTTAESATGPDKYGRLSGDLVLVGRGDPNLSGRTLPYNLKTERPLSPAHVLEELADQVVARGVKVIDGDIIADDSFFVYERFGEGWSLGDIVWGWGAPVSALADQRQCSVLEYSSRRAGRRARIYQHCAICRVLPHRKPHDDLSGGRRAAQDLYPASAGLDAMEIWGNIPLDDAGTGEALAIEEPAEFCARLFWELLEKRGVILYGRTRARHTAMASLDAFSVTANAPWWWG